MPSQLGLEAGAGEGCSLFLTSLPSVKDWGISTLVSTAYGKLDFV